MTRHRARRMRHPAEELRLEAGLLKGESELLHSMIVSEKKRRQNELVASRRAAG